MAALRLFDSIPTNFLNRSSLLEYFSPLIFRYSVQKEYNFSFIPEFRRIFAALSHHDLLSERIEGELLLSNRRTFISFFSLPLPSNSIHPREILARFVISRNR